MQMRRFHAAKILPYCLPYLKEASDDLGARVLGSGGEENLSR